MAGKKKFTIKTPKVQTFRKGTVAIKLEWSQGFGSRKSQAFGKAQEFVDSECIRYMNPLTPRLTGAMIKSATLGTVIGSGKIQYNSPYARRQYYEHKTKKKWFETMKAGHKETIRKGAAKFAAGK